MQIITPLEQSYQQLTAWIMHRPPVSIRAHINESWKSEKAATEEKRNDRTTNTTNSANPIHSVYVHANRAERFALDR
jgi:hypothetical protein